MFEREYDSKILLIVVAHCHAAIFSPSGFYFISLSLLPKGLFRATVVNRRSQYFSIRRGSLHTTISLLYSVTSISTEPICFWRSTRQIRSMRVFVAIYTLSASIEENIKQQSGVWSVHPSIPFFLTSVRHAPSVPFSLYVRGLIPLLQVENIASAAVKGLITGLTTFSSSKRYSTSSVSWGRPSVSSGTQLIST